MSGHFWTSPPPPWALWVLLAWVVFCWALGLVLAVLRWRRHRRHFDRMAGLEAALTSLVEKHSRPRGQ
jgi:Flp pilus assembly protein TadB